MKVKRIFTHDTGKPVLSHLQILNHGKTQNFTQKFINKAIQDGFLSMSKGRITIHAQPNDLIYDVVRVPGMYCCHDDAPLADSKEALKYIEENWKDIPCPDANNPAGYREDHFYHCKLVEE